jgi:hypothetical protein
VEAIKMISDIKALFDLGQQIIKYFETYRSMREEDKDELCEFCRKVDYSLEHAINNLREFGGNNFSIHTSFEAGYLAAFVKHELTNRYPEIFNDKHVSLLKRAGLAISKLERIPNLTDEERLTFIDVINQARATFRVLEQQIKFLG